jgi:hypothetical protein
MKFLTRRWKWIGIGIIIILTSCCLAFSAYKVIVWQERDDCFAHLANEWNVDPTFHSIGNAVLAQLQPELNFSMGQSETHTVLSRIAPILTKIEGPTLDGGIDELVFIQICKYPENSLTYLVTYTKEGIFQDIKLVWDD